MDTLKIPVLLAFGVADGTFLHGMLSGLHLPTTEEGWGTTIGAALLLIISQLVQGHFNARRWRKLFLKQQAATPHPPIS